MSDKKLFVYGQKEPVEVSGTLVAEIACENTLKECADEFTVIKGALKPLLGRSTVENLNALRVGPVGEPQVCFVVPERSDESIRRQYADILIGVGVR